MSAYKLNIMIIGSMPSMDKIVEAFKLYSTETDSDFGVLNYEADGGNIVATIYKKKLKTVRVVNLELRTVDVGEVDDVKLVSLKIMTDSKRIEVYTGTDSDRKLVTDFFSDANLAIETSSPSVNLYKFATDFRASNKFSVPRIAGSEYVGSEEAQGEFVAKFSDSDKALEFLEGGHGSHAHTIKISFRAKFGKASITAHPDGCFAISCKEEDQDHLFDRVRNAIGVV